MSDSKLLGLGVGAVGLYILYPTICEWFSEMNSLSLLTNRKVEDEIEDYERHTTGLVNAGNFCYINSDIQALASLPATFGYLTKFGYLCPADGAAMAPVSSSLFYFVRELHRPVTKKRTISPEPLITAIEQTYKSRMSRRQHDAHELLHLLLETLQKEFVALTQKSRSNHDLEAVLDFPYEGTLVDEIICGNCHTHTEKASKYLILSVAVPSQSKTTLADLLKENTQPEYINDYACITCRVKNVMASENPRLKELQEQLADATLPLPADLEEQLPKMYSPVFKTQRFDSEPQILCIHLSRSIYTGSFAARNSCKVEFPLELSLPGKKARYRLYAMIRHSGTHQTGHYECSRRKNTGFWRKINWSSLFESTSTSGEVEASEEPQEPGPEESTNTDLPFPHKSKPSTSLSTEPVTAAQQPSSAPREEPARPRKQSSKQWWAISDNEVRETTSRAVQSLQSGAYLLFYQRV